VGVRARLLVARGAGAVWLVLVLYLTLRPVGWIQHIGFWAFWASIQSGVDVAQNLVMFAPMGWIARRGRWSAWRTVAVAFAISAFIEFAQQWVPGRASQARDIVCNALGALIAWWMAAPVTRPRVRLAGAFASLALFLGLHVLNTAWRHPAVDVTGEGAWVSPARHACAPPAGDQTVCVAVPNTAQRGDRHVTVIGPDARTYAHVQSRVLGPPLGRDDCVWIKFENTRGHVLLLRPPRLDACGLADTSARTVELRVDPRREYEAGAGWVATRASVWLWPVWPFDEYRPAVVSAAGALVFVIGAALFAGTASWVIPAGYLVLLEFAALMVGMRAPMWLDAVWTMLAWITAVGAVALDRRWQHHSV
jgi:hypothetical protein